MTKEQMKNAYGYAISNWIERFQSYPVEEVYHEDKSESYEMDCIHVFKLEDGKYAVVTESGCSCYESSDADIEIFPTEAQAKEQFDKWLSRFKDTGN